MSSDEELRTCLDGFSEYVADRAQIHFDAFKANVTRVDYCHDWQLTSELVKKYMWSLRGVSMPRMHRTLIDNCTVQLSNASQAICFYDKFEEPLTMNPKSDEELTAAKGVLRFEMRFRDNRSCHRHARRMGARDRTAASLLNLAIAQHSFRTTLNRLGLDKPLTCGSRRAELLRAHFPDDRSKVLSLMGMLALSDKYGIENLVDLGFCSYSGFRRKLAELKAAGVLYESDGSTSLAPLTEVQSVGIKDSEAA